MKSSANVVFTGFLSFFVFCFSWLFGYVFGYIMMILGLRRELREVLSDSGERDEIEEMIEKMNREGPNN